MIISHTTSAVKRPALKLPSFASVDEFLRINPLPATLRHLEPSLRQLPNVEMLFDVLLGCLAYDMGADDFTNIINAVGGIYSRPTQRCAGCFHWTSEFHAIVIGKAQRFAAVPMCDTCVRRFEAGTESAQMRRNLDSYAEVAK